MNTEKLMQAVNDLRGDLRNLERVTSASIIKYVGEGSVHMNCRYAGYPYKNKSGLLDEWSFICKTEEFDALVRELSEAKWIPERDESVWLTDKDGNQYQKNAIYEFSDDGNYWYHRELTTIASLSQPFVSNGSYFSRIREPQVKVVTGTIKKPELKLEEGSIYQFDINGATEFGVYRLGDFYMDGVWYYKQGCTNIVKLVPESKA